MEQAQCKWLGFEFYFYPKIYCYFIYDGDTAKLGRLVWLDKVKLYFAKLSSITFL